MPERLRRFLLLPGPGGEEAERLGSPSAFYLGILVVPPEDRHSLALVLLELLAPAPLKGPARRWVWGISL